MKVAIMAQLYQEQQRLPIVAFDGYYDAEANEVFAATIAAQLQLTQ